MPKNPTVNLTSAKATSSPNWVYERDIAFGPSMYVRQFRLTNGLRVLLLVDHTAPVIAYHTWYQVGSRDESPGKTGLAHLFEHLMFNETTNLAAGEFDRTLEENGAESNAGTWVDWTYYHESLPASKLELIIRLEADRMANLVLRDPQVTSEKEVVANERRYRVDDDIEGSINELLYKTSFTTHPYHWPTIGWMQDIQNFSTQDCQDFYRTFYAPNNATVVIVGDLDEEKTLQLIHTYYGSLPAVSISTRTYPVEPIQTEERRLEVKKPTATEKLMIGYKSPALGNQEHAVLTVLNEILFGGRSSRAYRTFIKKNELATDIRGWVSTFADPGLYEMYITARESFSARELEPVLHSLLNELCTELVRNEELEKAKSRLELGFLQGLETASGKAEQIGFYHTVLGDPGAGFTRLTEYLNVTPHDILRVAKAYLRDNQRTVIYVLPDGSSSEPVESTPEPTFL